MSLTFSDFKLPQSDKCNTDFLEIRRYNSSGNLLGVFCGDKKPVDISMEGSLWLFLKTSENKDGTGLGFKANFAIGNENSRYLDTSNW